jgi:hypothetical protein
MKNSKKKAHLIDKIVGIELWMFQKVRTIEPSLCQERLDTFKLMREMGHSVLSLETLTSYLKDLEKAKCTNRNLVTEKYARMSNMIPPLNQSSALNDIMVIESSWMKELEQKYPSILKQNSKYFERYLSDELETYSNETLNLYLNDIVKAKAAKRNLVEERYLYLFKKLGYNSLDDVNKKYSHK